jgi:ppGpp synthetase/RelA/SpoT-type nucleotidyltranferase
MVAQILDSTLQSAGIRAIVTSRAKNPTRLEAKVRQRAVKENYQSVDDIYDDIVDLAGVRVALYFPGEREEVGKVIQNLFSLVSDPKEFPTAAQPTYKKRFSGYWATHYRVRIPDGSLNESQKRYTEARVEVQVASVLMHAWSEVEHDLVYKPLQGNLSDEEYAILDELNGLVLSGEIALERLQRAGDLSDVNLNEASIGRVDVLYQLLKATNLDTPDQLKRFVTFLHSDIEKRPLSEQIIDQVLAEDPARYAVYDQIRLSEASIALQTSDSSRISQSQAIGEFMALWIEYERRVRAMAANSDESSLVMPTTRFLYQFNLPQEILASADRLRRFRNQLVHGIEVPDAESIRAETEELRSLLGTIPFDREAKGRRTTSKRTPARKPRRPADPQT